jgi:uncharacterized membrane protein
MSGRPTLGRLLRNKFLAGLLILVPAVITVKALVWLFTYVDEMARPLAVRLVGHEIPGTGFVITIAVILLTGLLFSTGPLRRALEGLEDVFEHVPIAGTLYGTLKKVISGFGGSGSQKAFQKFVLARLPGRTTPGFLTGSFTLTRRDGSRRLLYTVYVPTNHLYIGDVVVLPHEDVIETDLSVEDGIGCLLSAGASFPSAVGERDEDSSREA